MSTYRLIYFQCRARAEVSRMILAVAGQQYENKRVQELTEPDYSKSLWFKPEEIIKTEEWRELQKKVPFGQLPVLEVDGQMIAQSKVIAAFLAKRFGLVGRTDVDEARAAMIAETINDGFLDQFLTLFGETDLEKQKEDIKKYETETLPDLMTKLEKLVGDKGFFVADQLTYADIAFYCNSEWPAYFKINIPWEKFPKLKTVAQHVESHPGIAKHLQERPNDLF